MRAWLLLLLIARAASASPGSVVIADISINGVGHPAALITVVVDGGILARKADMAIWNLDIRDAPVELLQGINHIRLTGLAGVRAKFEGVTLMLEVAESAFEKTSIDLKKDTPQVVDGGKGVYVNYDLSSFGGRGQRRAFATAVEGVVYADTMSFTSNGVLSSAYMSRRFVRYESSMRWDFPEHAQSLVVGDAISRSGALSRAFRFGGISFGTNFATRPDIVTFPLPTVPGESRIPTAAELLINGQAHSQFALNPGPFEISNVPAINGAGEIQLVTRDPLGRQQVLVIPYYVTPALLSAGLTDAGFDLGKIREDFGLESFRYGRHFARGQLRHGLTSSLTLDALAETDGRLHVAGGGLTTALGNIAVASAAIAVSKNDDAGTSLSASLERSSRGLSFGLRAQYSSRHFTQIGEVSGLRYRLNANVGLSLGMLGNVRALYATESRLDRGRMATTAISYQKQLGNSISLLANFSATRTDEGMRHFAGLALVLPLDALTSAAISATKQNAVDEQVLDVRQNLPSDDGWATRARVTRGASRGPRLDAGLTMQNAVGQWSADISHANNSENFRLGVNGSLVMLGGAVHAVRQLGEAFAIVSVPGYPGIDVFHENQRVAQTDASGFAIIPRLRPYEANAVSLDTLKLSLSTELSASHRTVTPARRAGVLLQFKATKTHGALVSVVQQNGEPVPAGALMRTSGGSFPIAANGQAWVTGLGAETDAIVAWLGERCTLRIPMPDASKARPRIGPLTCKREAA